MLFHMSIAAHQPRRVAEVIAEFWGGEAFPFPPISDDGWIALAGDDRGSAVEVYPVDVVLRETDGDADAHAVYTGTPAYTATHGAIATHLSSGAIFGIALREGWPAKYRKRGGVFGVIELWIEGRQMIEVLTPEMQAEYTSSVTIEGWRQMLAAGPVPAHA